MKWLKENLLISCIIALIVGFIFTTGVFHLFGEVGVAIFLTLYFVSLYLWIKNKSNKLEDN